MNRPEILSRVKSFLATRTPPKHLANEGAKDDLINQIVDVLDKHKPEGAGAPWFGEIAEKVTIKTKGFVWPNPGAWGEAVGVATAKHTKQRTAALGADTTETARSDAVFADRLNNGQPVGEPQIFGQQADRCLSDGRIGLAKLRGYQRAAYAIRVKQMGKAKCQAWLQEVCPPLFAEMFPKLAPERLPYKDDDQPQPHEDF